MKDADAINDFVSESTDEAMFLLKLVNFLMEQAREMVLKKDIKTIGGEKLVEVSIELHYTRLKDLACGFFSSVPIRPYTSEEYNFIWKLTHFVTDSAFEISHPACAYDPYLEHHKAYFRLSELAVSFFSERSDGRNSSE